MATLQSARLGSAFAAKSRLQTISNHQPSHADSPAKLPDHPLSARSGRAALPSETPASRSDQGLTELQHRQLMLRATSVFPGWLLVSIQHRPDNGALVAHLVRSNDKEDPVLAIRHGRSIQIIMDASGDLRIQQPRHKRQGILARLRHWFRTAPRGHRTALSSAYGANVDL